jgi:hypothetical protein
MPIYSGGLLFGLGQSRQEHRGQEGDNRDDDEQFDEGEAVAQAPRGGKGLRAGVL